MITDMFKEKLIEVKLLNYIKLTLVISTICLFFNLFHRAKPFFVSEATGLSSDSSKRDFCTMAFNQMINKKLSKKIISDGLYDLVVEQNYKNMLFEEADSVGSVFSSDDSCKVLINTKDGLRSFDLFLETEGDADFYYLITKIRENELYEKEN